MKRFLICVGIVLSALCTLAQNANQSGIIFELGGGGVIYGPMYYDGYYDKKYQTLAEAEEDIKKLSGFTLSGDLGYRWACSRHWAVELKGKYEVNTGSPNVYMGIGPMLGARYTSPDFGNMSLYASAAIGCMFQVHDYDFISYYKIRFEQETYYGNIREYYHLSYNPFSIVIPAYEISVGLNFTRRFYGGLNWCGQQLINDDNYHHFGNLGIKLGFRFW